MRKLFLLLFFITGAIAAQPMNKSFFGNQAVHGYDVVSYFSGHPVPGKPEIKTVWMGAVWLFSTSENLQAFKETPSKYAPQYGGFCAFAMATGDFADIDPLSWTILAGKLYLNYDHDIQQRWEAKKTEFIKAADDAWAKQR